LAFHAAVPLDEAEHRHAALLVEDDYDTREALTLLIESMGVNVRAVANGREALEALHAGPRPCLIILDVAMPEMDGFTFRRVQLADPAIADIPVAVVSGAGWAVEREGRSLGITTFLRKPIEPDALLAALGQHCGASG
jgi:CheY-like chemotaxis protein